MPRRRMIDPDFWSDGRIKHLNPTEKLFFLGLISHADDEGRIQANPAFLRSVIFPYDDFTLEQINNMRSHILETNPNVKLYENSGEDYLYFKKWERYQKPSHPQPSKLPKPPKEPELQESVQEPVREPDQPKTRTIPSQVRSGQSSQGKVSIGQVSAVQEDFTKSLDTDTDLTDLLMTTLTKNISAGRAQAAAAQPGQDLSPEIEAKVKVNWGIQVLKKCWSDGVGGDIPQAIFDGARKALNEYPLEVVAKAFAKGVRYKGGKHKSWKYIQTIIDEEVEKRGGARARSP